MTEGELKPCEHSLAPEEVTGTDLMGVEHYWFVCPHVWQKCSGPSGFSRDEAITAWNNRARKD